MHAAGLADRLAEIEAESFPGDEELRFVAEVLKTSDAVVLPAIVFGAQPIGLEVLQCFAADASGNRAGHFHCASGLGSRTAS